MSIDTQFVQGQKEVLETTRRELVETARRKSDGPLREPDRRREDYPYASRHGLLGIPSAMPEGNPGIINAPTGKFRDDWKDTSTGKSAAVTNTNPVGQYLDGTDKMIRRPIEETIADEVFSKFEKKVDKFLEDLEF